VDASLDVAGLRGSHEGMMECTTSGVLASSHAGKSRPLGSDKRAGTAAPPGRGELLSVRTRLVLRKAHQLSSLFLTMKVTRVGWVTWQGGINDGAGEISTASGALKEYPSGFFNRFDGNPGSNPEELIAAAYASCFTMALSLILNKAQLNVERLETSAEVILQQVGRGHAITAIRLTLKGKVPRIDQATFQKLAVRAKAGCPVSRLLNTKATLKATLVA
jgi:osmotically inducible protein OsmC